jgi:DedD protein
MAAAIILIPEMLSGPKHNDQLQQPQSGAPLKTYTIDLNRSPGVPATAQLEERAPPPEMAANSHSPNEEAGRTEGGPPPGSHSGGTQAFAESGETAHVPPAERVTSEPVRKLPTVQPSAQPPRPEAKPETTPVTAAPPIVSSPSIPTSRGWAVQLGSFASKATADRLVNELAGSGQNAFVMPVKSGTATLYRVRIGPFADRAAANDALRGVKGRVANAAVVAHP